MTAKEKNKKIRYLRIQKMYSRLKEYHLSSDYALEVICDFFNVESTTVWNARSEKIQPSITYKYAHLDEIWVDRLVKEILGKKPDRKAVEPKSQQKQLSLL